MKAGICLALFLSFAAACALLYAQVPAASQMLRQEELLKKQEGLEEQLQYKGKVYVRKITITGNTLLNREQIYDATVPFINKWLNLDEIEQLIDDLLRVYAAQQKEVSISYTLEQNGILNIEIQEKLPLDK